MSSDLTVLVKHDTAMTIQDFKPALHSALGLSAPKIPTASSVKDGTSLSGSVFCAFSSVDSAALAYYDARTTYWDFRDLIGAFGSRGCLSMVI